MDIFFSLLEQINFVSLFSLNCNLLSVKLVITFHPVPVDSFEDLFGFTTTCVLNYLIIQTWLNRGDGGEGIITNYLNITIFVSIHLYTDFLIVTVMFSIK